MSHTNNFFTAKKPWSILKDQILDYYLTPYIAKILKTGKPLTIIDCFAGKGQFDDGETGSPIIIAQHIEQALTNSSRPKDYIKAVFIEKKYYEDLKTNLSSFNNCYVWPGTFEDHLKRILSLNQNNNVFIYIDPYGIKSLDFNRFKELEHKRFYTLEILLNFNSVGFLREGCRLLSCDNPEIYLDEGDEYEFDEANNIPNMNRIANGEYWHDLVESLRDNKITMQQAEERFMANYMKQINSLFSYVVNIPIKQKTNGLPKYRLVFGTNNQDGLLLMVENMHKKWQKIIDEQRSGQLVLFDIYEFPDFALYTESNLQEDIIKMLKIAGGSLLLKDLIVMLILKYGVTYPISHYKNQIKFMKLNLRWDPPKTPTGRIPSSMNYDDYKIWVSL